MKLNRTASVRWLSVIVVGAMILSGCAQNNQQVVVVASQSTATKTVQPQASATPTDDQPDDTDTPEPTETATPLPTSTPTLAPTLATVTVVPTPDPKAARNMLIAAFQKLNTAYPFRLTELTTMGGSPLDRMTDFAAADRTHTTFNSGSPVANLEEVIRVGGTTYWKINGTWSINDSSSSQPMLDLASMLIAGLSDVQYAGMETVNGVPSFVFTFKLSISSSGTALIGTGKAWVGIADGLPHQADMVGSLGGYALKSHLVYSYGVSFNIQPPIQ
jgi:hypothetical protein